MAIEAVCGSCGRRYQAPDAMAGKRVKCKQCGSVFAIPEPQAHENPDFDGLSEFDGADAARATRQGVSTRAGTHYTEENVVGSDVGDENTDDGAADAGAGGEDGEEAPVGRRNVRFRYKYAQMLDAWLAPAIVVGGLAWVSLAVARAEDVPGWLVATRVGVMLLFYTVVIVPLTLRSLRMAGRAMRYQLPSNPIWRTFASYMPAFALGLVMWNAGGGAGVALFLGVLLGLGISASALWALFRLQPQEIAPSAGYGTGGFLIGTVVTGLILFGLNMLIVQTLIEAKKEPPMPSSPFGQAFAWVPKAEAPPAIVKRPLAPTGTTQPIANVDLRSGQPLAPIAPPMPPIPGSTQPAIAMPETVTPGIAPVNPGAIVQVPGDSTGEPFPDAKSSPADPDTVPRDLQNVAPLTIVRRPPSTVVRTPAAASPLISKLETAPLEGNFEAFLRPSGKSAFAAVVRSAEGNNVPIELWDVDAFKRKAAATFSSPGGSQDANFALSPDGVHLARVAVFPKPSVQVWSFAESRVDRSIDIFDPPNAFELIGFVSDSRLLARVDTGAATTIRWVDINTKKAKVIDVGALLPRGTASIATNPTGSLLAVASKFGNEPVISIYTLETGVLARRIKVTALGQNMNVAPTGMAFSPDGTQISAIFEQDGGALIVTYVVATAKPVGEPHLYPATPIPARQGAAFGGSALAWLPRGNAWMLYGDAVIDAATGRVIERLNVPHVIAQRFPAPDTVELTTQDPANPRDRQLLRVKLDPAKLPAGEPPK